MDGISPSSTAAPHRTPVRSLAIAAALLGLLAAAPQAGATTTCSYSAGVVTVSVGPTVPGTLPALYLGSPNKILAGDGTGTQCGAVATVNNTDNMVVNDDTPGGAGAVAPAVSNPAGFAPGATGEAGTSSE